MDQNALRILKERFGKDNVIALGTMNGDYPAVRDVDAYYEDDAFYVITYALSSKMKQIGINNKVAICGEWFTSTGKAESLGYFGKEENKEIALKLKKAFASWIDNGDNNFEDENTIILKICLENAILFSHGTKYELDFSKESL